VTVDNVDLTVNDAIRTLTGDPPTVTMMVVLADSPDTVEAGPFVYSLQNAQADAQTIQGALGFEQDIFSQQVPSQTYTPVSSPGLFL
jgi:predicted membrane GTPase involved in stress response